MKKKIYNMIEPSDDANSKLSSIYDIVMLVSIIASLIPLLSKADNMVFSIIDKTTVTIFIIDYLLRLLTCNIKLKKGISSYFLYPFQPMAIIDILSILPSIIPINSGFKVLRLFRIIRTLKVFRSFKLFRYSKNIKRITKVLKSQASTLGAVLSLAIFYIVVTALIMFNLEPDTFNNFFEAMYWSAISLTSVGYGDIIPMTAVGRLFTIISAFVGVAIIALPSGIITAGYIDVLQEEKNNKNTDE